MGELLIIFLAILVLFGANQIPKVARNLGQGMREFKKATRELTEDDPKDAEAPPRKDQPPTA
ncbi:MAG: twin-arginine translocase TatA/TatE family subunit [Candidatus Eisenbacteria bacterium]